MTSCLHPLCDPEHTNTFCVVGVCFSHPLCSANKLIVLSVVVAEGKRPVPSRTRKLSPPAPMVLHSPGCGRVGRRRHQTSVQNAPPGDRRGILHFQVDYSPPPIERRICSRRSRAAASRSSSCSAIARPASLSSASSVPPCAVAYRPSILSRTCSNVGTPASS